MSDMQSPPAKEPPPLNIPSSSHIVDVSIINTTSRIQDISTSVFLEPNYKNFTHLDCPAFSFLITHPPTGSKYLFDLGIRKDWKNLSGPINHRITSNKWQLTIEHGVAEIFDSAGVPPSSINGIIWSHHHWDHTGDPSTFPPSTSLIVGPGVKNAFMPGFPKNSSSPILESDYTGRQLREMSFDDHEKNSGNLKIGRFRALDFFGDGSFYLLDTPGHAIGHMCGLARTTTAAATAGESDTFILLGGDIAHHGGEIRPTPYLPLPTTLPPSSASLAPNIHHQTHGHSHPDKDTSSSSYNQHHRLYPSPQSFTQPFTLPSANAAHNHVQALDTVAGIGEIDAHERVLTCLAHDASLVGVVGLFPEEGANEWFVKGWKEKTLWRWVGDYEGGLKVEGEGEKVV